MRRFDYPNYLVVFETICKFAVENIYEHTDNKRKPTKEGLDFTDA